MLLQRVTASVLLITSTACMSVRAVPSPRDFLNTHQPGRIWVTSGQSQRLEIDAPKVLTDTVFGFGATGDQVVFPISEIRELRAPQVNVGRTVGVIALFTAAGVVAIAAFQGLKGDSEQEITEDYRAHFPLRFHVKFP